MGCTSLCSSKKDKKIKNKHYSKGRSKRRITADGRSKRRITADEDQKEELQQTEDQKESLVNNSNNENISGPPKTISEPELGEFDDNFTWSAMVLAAQGKKMIKYR